MRALTLALVLLAAGLSPSTVVAAEWDAIRPGESTQATVRAQFGQPTKVSSEKIEGYDSAQWLYEGEQAPRGMVRVAIDFGILTPQGYRADLVRVMKLAPRPGVFTRNTVVAGWGLPQRVGKEKDADVFFYEAGLLVFFDKSGRVAETMIFTPPQRPGQGAAPPTR
jgi:hypothetical protein